MVRSHSHPFVFFSVRRAAVLFQFRFARFRFVRFCTVRAVRLAPVRALSVVPPVRVPWRFAVRTVPVHAGAGASVCVWYVCVRVCVCVCLRVRVRVRPGEGLWRSSEGAWVLLGCLAGSVEVLGGFMGSPQLEFL